jgi:hypothetical protein
MMSGVRESEQILNNVLKAKGVSREIISNIQQSERDALRVMSVVSQMARGDVTGLVLQLSRLGPYGVAAAAVVATAAVAYGIYHQLTAEKPTEYYYWRYPK